jgi:hypothetical protein
MSNSIEIATLWTQFVATRPYVPNGTLLLKHYEAGSITRLCECGCQSYDLEINDSAALDPMLALVTTPGRLISLSYWINNDRRGYLDIDVFVDVRGYLSGIDVSFCANSFPVPDGATPVEPPELIAGRLVSAGS